MAEAVAEPSHSIQHCRAHHLMLFGVPMRTTLALDDALVAEASALTGLTEKSALVREALKALIAREAGRRLARLGGSDPDATAAARRRENP